MTTLLRQRRLRWLGHVRRMEDGRIPKDILYSELDKGKRTTGRPHPRYNDVCKRDLKALDIEVKSWDELTEDKSSWRKVLVLTAGLEAGERNLQQDVEENRLKRRSRANQSTTNATFQCQKCSKNCHSRVGS